MNRDEIRANQASTGAFISDRLQQSPLYNVQPRRIFQGRHRLKVLQVGKYYPPYRGGMEHHLQALCRELRDAVSVKVVVANEQRRETVNNIDGVQVKRLAPLFNVGSAPICPSLSREIRNSQADVVHLHVPNPPAMLALIASGYNGPLVLTWHSDIIRQTALLPLVRPLERILMNRCDAIVATSPNYIDSSSTLSRYRDKCHVIPHGISTELFATRNEENVGRIRAKYGERIILTVGRLVYYKGFEHLVRAMAKIDGHLLVIGEGPLRTNLEWEAITAGTRSKISFLGKIGEDEMIDFMHAADVFALPSIARSEAFGIVQLEAMACGKPVVNTRLNTGVPFVSIDGVTGITVPPKEPAALARAVNRLLDDDQLRANFGAAARHRVQEEFTADLMAKRTLELYSRVCLERSAGRDVLVRANQVGERPI